MGILKKIAKFSYKSLKPKYVMSKLFGGKKDSDFSTPVVSTVAKVMKPSATDSAEARRRAAAARGRYMSQTVADGDTKLGA